MANTTLWQKNGNPNPADAPLAGGEVGTLFGVTTTVDILGFRIWNAGTTSHPGRTAKLWKTNRYVMTTFSAAELIIPALALPDTLPVGWSEHLLVTPVTLVRGEEYAVSYDTEDYGVLSNYARDRDGVFTYTGGLTGAADFFPSVLSTSNFTGIEPVYSDAVADGPIFELYGGEGVTGQELSFGANGQAELHVNVKGTVDPGCDAVTLTGAVTAISDVGPTARRLKQAGEFNLTIPTGNLAIGENVCFLHVDLHRPSGTTDESALPIYIDWTENHPTPSMTVDWSTVLKPQEKAWPIDGDWDVSGPSAILPMEQAGYDRLLGIGDVSWKNYEVTVSATIDEIDPLYDQSSFGGERWAVGMILGWQGHWDDGNDPPIDYSPLGCIVWYEGYNNRLEVVRNDGAGSLDADPSFVAVEGDTVHFKVRRTNFLGAPMYAVKAWRNLETEPASWNMFVGEAGAQVSGSVVLLSHFCASEWSNVVVSPLPEPYSDSLWVLAGNGNDLPQDSNPTDDTEYEQGTMFTVSVSTDLGAIGIYNPGKISRPGRTAKIWNVDTSTLMDEVSIPDQLPFGYSTHEFGSPVSLLVGVNYMVTYDCGLASSGLSDYMYTPFSTETVGPFTLTGGRYGATPDVMPTSNNGTFFGVEPLEDNSIVGGIQNIYAGTTQATKVYAGATEINKIYAGDTVVWEV